MPGCPAGRYELSGSVDEPVCVEVVDGVGRVERVVAPRGGVAFQLRLRPQVPVGEEERDDGLLGQLDGV